jgi:RNA polymerase sigma factor for flagellar operon FliA
MDVVDFVAYRLARRLGSRVPIDDLKAAGREALVEVARTFDPSRSQFKTYAARKIQWAILDLYRRETHGRALAARAQALSSAARFVEGFEAELPAGEMPTEEAYQERFRELLAGQAAALACGLIAPVGDLSAAPDAGESPEELLAKRQLRDALIDAVAELPERERELIDRHYFGGEQFESIAAELGISKSWASRVHAQGILLLAKALGAFSR